MESIVADDSDDKLLSLSFNQDGGCLAIGTAKGFRICNVSPFQETCRRTFAAETSKTKTKTNTKTKTTRTTPVSSSADYNDDDSNDSDDNENTTENDEIDSSSTSRRGGGIGTIEMLFRCNLYALVGGGAYPHYPPNRCIIWDDHCGRDAGYLIFRQRVLTVRLRRDRICIALRDKVYVYNFSNLGEVLDTIPTGGETNGAGLLCISTESACIRNTSSSYPSGSTSSRDEEDGMILACPSLKRGQVRVEFYGHRESVLIDAHEGALAAMALTVDGSLLATASERGTLIRLFDTGQQLVGGGDDRKSTSLPSGTPLCEFRRGVEQATVGCLCFSYDRHWLGCTSNRGTVHIFRVAVPKEEEDEGRDSDGKEQVSARRGGEGKVSTSTASKFVRNFLPRILSKSSKKFSLDGEHSYARVRGIAYPQTCAFVPDRENTIAVAGLDDYGNGCLLLASFGPEDEGGEDGGPRKNSNKSKCHVRRLAFHRFFKNDVSHIDGKKEDWSIGSGGGRGESGEALCIKEIDDSIDNLDEKTDDIVIRDNDADGFVSVSHDGVKKTAEVSSLDLYQDEEDNQEIHEDCDDGI